MRRFIAELRPPTLEKQGLDAALRELCERATAADTITVRYEGQPLPRLAPEHEIVIYRVAQEALNNAAKHAPDAIVCVHLNVSDDQVTLTVRDDGPGFDQHSVAERLHGRHWGLAGMRERAALVGAHLTIASRVGHGAEIRLLVALHAPNALPIPQNASSIDLSL
jgi:two-component system sensor histidine kinase DegS